MFLVWHQGFLLLIWISFISNISNYTHHKMWDEITYPFDKLLWYSSWMLEIDKQFHRTIYWAYDYLCRD